MKYVIGFIVVLLFLYLLFGPSVFGVTGDAMNWVEKILKLTRFKGILM